MYNVINKCYQLFPITANGFKFPFVGLRNCKINNAYDAVIGTSFNVRLLLNST